MTLDDFVTRTILPLLCMCNIALMLFALCAPRSVAYSSKSMAEKCAYEALFPDSSDNLGTEIWL